ncbi:hypothetical protein SDC9_70912 [bioreactor metagenome]|uniref:Uncharacterized protein n=1 Tax=bioreactor metagenome TaxID=1076179 RepID=A0A644Y7I5_9ZZZZ
MQGAHTAQARVTSAEIVNGNLEILLLIVRNGVCKNAHLSNGASLRNFKNNIIGVKSVFLQLFVGKALPEVRIVDQVWIHIQKKL